MVGLKVLFLVVVFPRVPWRAVVMVDVGREYSSTLNERCLSLRSLITLGFYFIIFMSPSRIYWSGGRGWGGRGARWIPQGAEWFKTRKKMQRFNTRINASPKGKKKGVSLRGERKVYRFKTRNVYVRTIRESVLRKGFTAVLL